MNKQPVGFFTSGIQYSLPHPNIPKSHIVIVHNAVACALRLLREEPPTNFDLSSADEDTITRQLAEVLENRLRQTGEVNGFNSNLFSRVTRDEKITNFNSKHPDKMPDLLFRFSEERLSIISNQDALFAECKPVTKSRSCGAHYCDRGMARFVAGDYAWAMQEGLMIAYVRDGRTIEKNLSPAIEKRSSLKVKKGLTAIPAKTESKELLHVTKHDRSIDWLNGEPATSIALFHSWHYCGESAGNS